MEAEEVQFFVPTVDECDVRFGAHMYHVRRPPGGVISWFAGLKNALENFYCVALPVRVRMPWGVTLDGVIACTDDRTCFATGDCDSIWLRLSTAQFARILLRAYREHPEEWLSFALGTDDPDEPRRQVVRGLLFALVTDLCRYLGVQ